MITLLVLSLILLALGLMGSMTPSCPFCGTRRPPPRAGDDVLGCGRCLTRWRASDGRMISGPPALRGGPG